MGNASGIAFREDGLLPVPVQLQPEASATSAA